MENSKHGQAVQKNVFLVHFPLQHKLFFPLPGHVVGKVSPLGVQVGIGFEVVGLLVVGWDVGLRVSHVLIGLDGVGDIGGKATDKGQIFMSSIPASIRSPAVSPETIPSEARMRSWTVDSEGIAGYLASVQAARLATSQMETTGVHAPPLIATSRWK